MTSSEAALDFERAKNVLLAFGPVQKSARASSKGSIVPADAEDAFSLDNAMHVKSKTARVKKNSSEPDGTAADTRRSDESVAETGSLAQIWRHRSGIWKRIKDGEIQSVKDLECHRAEIVQGLDDPKPDIKLRGAVGETILHACFLYNRPETAKRLVELLEQEKDATKRKMYVYTYVNAEYTAKPFIGETCLHMAIVMKHLDSVQFLISKGAKLSCRATGSFFQETLQYGEYPLSFAAAVGAEDIAAHILEVGLTDPEDRCHRSVDTDHDEAQPSPSVEKVDDTTSSKNGWSSVGGGWSRVRGLVREEPASPGRGGPRRNERDRDRELDEKFSRKRKDDDASSNPYLLATTWQDSNGWTVLHMCVLYDNPRIYDLVLKAWRTNQPADPQADVELEDVLLPLERIPDADGFTPLALAAKLGRVEIFTHIVDKHRKKMVWTYGPVTASLVPLEEIEPYNCVRVFRDETGKEAQGKFEKSLHASVLTTLLEYDRTELIVHPVIARLIQNKWHGFAHSFFIWWMLIELLYTVVIAVAAFTRPAPACWDLSRSDCTNKGIARAVAEALIVIGLPFHIIGYLSMWDSFKASTNTGGTTWQATKTFGRLLSQLLGAWKLLVRLVFLSSFATTVMILAVLSQRVLDHNEAGIAVILCVCWCWWLMFFSRGFELTGPYMVVLVKMVSGDFTRILLLYATIVLGFAEAFYIAYIPSVDNSSNLEKLYGSPGRAFRTLIMMTMGEYGDVIDGLSESEAAGEELMSALVIAYAVVTTIMLVNLLIAMMSRTFDDIIQRAEKEWLLQRAGIVLMIEKVLAKWGRKLEHPAEYVNRRGRRFVLIQETQQPIKLTDAEKVTQSVADLRRHVDERLDGLATQLRELRRAASSPDGRDHANGLTGPGRGPGSGSGPSSEPEGKEGKPVQNKGPPPTSGGAGDRTARQEDKGRRPPLGSVSESDSESDPEPGGRGVSPPREVVISTKVRAGAGMQWPSLAPADKDKEKDRPPTSAAFPNPRSSGARQHGGGVAEASDEEMRLPLPGHSAHQDAVLTTFESQ